MKNSIKKLILATLIIYLSLLSATVMAQYEATNEKDTSTEAEQKIPDAAEVVVTAERSDVELAELPRAVSVVTAEDITEGLLRSAPEALRLETGVLVQRTNMGGGSPFIRGMTGNQVLFLVDGIRINNSAVRGGPNQYLNTIDPLFIERIEVVRGIGSVLYGSDALGGVVNVITKRHDDFKLMYHYGVGLFGRASTAEEEETGSASVNLNITRKLGLVSVYSAKDFGHVDGGGDLGDQVPSGYEASDFGMNLDFPLHDHFKLQLGYQFSKATHVPNFDPSSILNEFQPQCRDLGYVRFNIDGLHQVVNLVELTFAYHDQLEGRNKIKSSSPNIRQEDEDTIQTYHGGLKVESRATDALQFVWGAEYYKDNIDSERELDHLDTGVIEHVTPQLADDSEYTSLAGYLEMQYEPVRWVRLVPGVRYSNFKVEAGLDDPNLGKLNFDSDNSDFTWAAHINFSPTVTHHIILGVARGFRAPSIDDMTKLGSEDGRFDIPNPNLEAEEASSYELGYRATFPHLSASLFGYYTQMSDLIARRPATYGGQQYIGTDEVHKNQNIGEALIYGVEGDFAWRFHAFGNHLIAGSVAYTYGKDEDSAKPLRRIPPVVGHFRYRFTPRNERWYVEPYFLFAGRQDRLSGGDIKDIRIPDGGTPGFMTYNLRAAFEFNDLLSIIVVGENLSDKKYKYHGSGVYEAGRNFKTGIELKVDL